MSNVVYGIVSILRCSRMQLLLILWTHMDPGDSGGRTFISTLVTGVDTDAQGRM